MKKTVNLIQNGMSSVSGINGELSHLMPSLFREVEEALFLFDWGLEVIDEISVLVEKG